MEPVDVRNDNNQPSPSQEGSPRGKSPLATKNPVSTGSSSKNGAPFGRGAKKAVKKRVPSKAGAKIPSQDGPTTNPKRKMLSKKTGMSQTTNPPKDILGADLPQGRTFAVKVNADDRVTARIFASLGVSTSVPDVPRLKNPHAIGAGVRAATMFRQTQLRTFVEAKSIVVLDPRVAELDFFKDFVTKKQLLSGQRRGVFGHDLAAGRALLNGDPLLPQTCYIANDNAYWYRPDTFFRYHRLWESPDFRSGGVNVLMSLFDFRGEGECVFLHRFQLPATDKWEEVRFRKVPMLNEEGTPIMITTPKGVTCTATTEKVSTIEHPAENAVDVLEGVGYKRDGIVTWYSAVGAAGTDAHYTHPWEADAFFEHSRYVFVAPDGTRVLMTCHVEGQMGFRTLFAINYSVAPVGSETSEIERVPTVGFVQNGFIPSLLNELRPKAMSVLREQDSAVRNFYRDCEGVYSRCLPVAQRAQLDFLGPTLYEARMRTYAMALEMQQSFYEPGCVVASVSDVAKSYRQRHLEERMSVGPTVSEPIVSLMGETTRLGFLLESLRAVKVWGMALWERLTAWYDRVGHWMQTGGVPIFFDMARLVQRALRAVPVVERQYNVIRESVLGYLWVKKSSESVVALLAKHPILDNAIHIMSQFLPIFLKATIEECLKRLASPVFLVIAAIEIVADAIDIFYAESYDREEVANFVRDSMIRILAHGLLTLMPLPVAVLLHTGVNCVQTWREKRVFVKLREAVLENALEQMMDDAELEPLAFRAEDYSWVPVTVYVKEGDGLVPVRDRPELLDVARHQEFATRKLVALRCEASELLGRPQGGLLSMCQMVKVRLESPTPKPDRDNIRMGYDVATEYIFREFKAVEPLTVPEFRVYIRGQEFSAAKEQWYMTRLDLLEKEGEPKVPIQPIVAKTDEVLPLRDDLAEVEKVKERPIYPIEVDQLDLMRWLLVWKRNFSEHFEVRRSGHLFTFTYMLDSRADLLDDWINRWSTEDGFHMLALGDDNIMMFVCHRRGWVGKNARFAAYDLATCDKTCGLDVQLCFVDLMRKGGLSDRQAEAHLARCKGLRELKIRGEPKDRKFYWESTQVSTVTGNPLTSIQAVFCQLLFVCMGWDQWVSGDADDPEELAALIHAAGTTNGHLLEWEYDIGVSRRFSNITRRTYLGGLFVPDEEGLKWCPMAWLKTFFLFPDTKLIYSGDNHMEMHAAAISTDQGMLRTPIGSALCATMRRLASAAGLTKMDFEEAAAKLHQSKSWYQRLKKTPLSLKPVSEQAFFAALQDLCYSRGFDDPIPEWLDLEAELLTISSLPATLGTSGIRCLYQPRFGAPKIERKGRLDVFAALENIVRDTRFVIVQLDYLSHAIVQLGPEDNMTKSKAAKARARAGKAPPKQQQNQPKKKAGRKRTNRKRNNRGGGFVQQANSAAEAPLSVSHGLGPFMRRDFTNNRGNREVHRREFVQNTAGSTAYAVTSFPVNPGMPNIFTWLSVEATQYSEYRFRRLRFRYQTDKSASTSGVVMQGFIPDATIAAPTSKQAFLDQAQAIDDVVWRPFDLEVDLPTETLRERYIRSGALAANQDIRFTDMGNFFVATDGCADATVIGEVWVEYIVELINPFVDPVALALATSADIIPVVGVDSNHSFGTAAAPITGGLSVTATGQLITFNRVGSFLVEMTVTGTGLHTAFTPNVGSSSTPTAPTLLTGISNAAADAGTTALVSWVVVVTARGQTMSINNFGQATTVTATNTRVAVYSGL